MSLLKFDFTTSELVRDKRTTKAAIEEIRQWMKLEGLPQIQEEQIILFLLSCDNDIPATQTTILAYYKYSSEATFLLNDRDLNTKEMKHILTVVESFISPKRTKSGHMVLFSRLKNTTYWNFNIDQAIRHLFMVFMTGLTKKPPPEGLIVCFDMKGVGLMHLTRLRLGPMKYFFHFVQEALPCKLKDIHLVNTVYFIDKLMAIIKPFMKRELYDMIHFHPTSMDWDEFYEKNIPKECCPSDYGGTLATYKEMDAMTVQRMGEMKDFFDGEEAQRKFYKPPK